LRFNASDVTVANRIDTPVEPKMLAELLKKFPDFERAYNEDGLSIDDFDSFGPTRRTLRQFIEACHEMCGQIRDVMIPNPDKLLDQK
jgi:transaldolase